MPRVLVPLAEGCEEMEAVITIDVLRRAKWDVVAAGIQPGPITASRKVKLIPDAGWGDIDPVTFDILAVPGGAVGVANLRKDGRVLQALREFNAAGKWIAAVCAAPLVLQEAGILAGRKVTCHPDNAAQISQGVYVDDSVVIDGNLLTSQGAGTCFRFALAIIANVESREKADSVARGMALRDVRGI